MAENIADALTGSLLTINPDGSINISGSLHLLGSIIIGSVSANVDSTYQTSGNAYIVSGTNLTGSMAVTTNPLPISGNAQIYAGAVGPAKIDSTTNVLAGIDYGHAEIHAGNHFFIENYTTLASGAKIDFGVTSPNTTKWAHMFWRIGATKETIIEVYKTSVLSGGTALSPVNNNQNSDNTSVMTVVQNPTVTDSGTLISASRFGIAAGVGVATRYGSGETRQEREIILHSGTSYLWRVKSATDTNYVSYKGTWYEHTNKN